jgi:hypothetical protein
MFTPKAPAAKIDSRDTGGKDTLAKIALNRAILGRKPAYSEQNVRPTNFKK